MLAELVRLAKIEKYKTAHEAGWLNNQFYGEFSGTGYSSYQVYIWAKERRIGVVPSWSNRKRLAALLKEIDHSGLAGVGGGGVYHYGCK